MDSEQRLPPLESVIQTTTNASENVCIDTRWYFEPKNKPQPFRGPPVPTFGLRKARIRTLRDGTNVMVKTASTSNTKSDTHSPAVTNEEVAKSNETVLSDEEPESSVYLYLPDGKRVNFEEDRRMNLVVPTVGGLQQPRSLALRSSPISRKQSPTTELEEIHSRGDQPLGSSTVQPPSMILKTKDRYVPSEARSLWELLLNADNARREAKVMRSLRARENSKSLREGQKQTSSPTSAIAISLGTKTINLRTLVHAPTAGGPAHQNVSVDLPFQPKLLTFRRLHHLRDHGLPDENGKQTAPSPHKQSHATSVVPTVEFSTRYLTSPVPLKCPTSYQKRLIRYEVLKLQMISGIHEDAVLTDDSGGSRVVVPLVAHFQLGQMQQKADQQRKLREEIEDALAKARNESRRISLNPNAGKKDVASHLVSSLVPPHPSRLKSPPSKRYGMLDLEDLPNGPMSAFKANSSRLTILPPLASPLKYSTSKNSANALPATENFTSKNVAPDSHNASSTIFSLANNKITSKAASNTRHDFSLADETYAPWSVSKLRAFLEILSSQEIVAEIRSLFHSLTSKGPITPIIYAALAKAFFMTMYVHLNPSEIWDLVLLDMPLDFLGGQRMYDVISLTDVSPKPPPLLQVDPVTSSESVAGRSGNQFVSGAQRPVATTRGGGGLMSDRGPLLRTLTAGNMTANNTSFFMFSNNNTRMHTPTNLQNSVQSVDFGPFLDLMSGRPGTGNSDVFSDHHFQAVLHSMVTANAQLLTTLGSIEQARLASDARHILEPYMNQRFRGPHPQPIINMSGTLNDRDEENTDMDVASESPTARAYPNIEAEAADRLMNGGMRSDSFNLQMRPGTVEGFALATPPPIYSAYHPEGQNTAPTTRTVLDTSNILKENIISSVQEPSLLPTFDIPHHPLTSRSEAPTTASVDIKLPKMPILRLGSPIRKPIAPETHTGFHPLKEYHNSSMTYDTTQTAHDPHKTILKSVSDTEIKGFDASMRLLRAADSHPMGFTDFLHWLQVLCLSWCENGTVAEALLFLSELRKFWEPLVDVLDVAYFPTMLARKRDFLFELQEALSKEEQLPPGDARMGCVPENYKEDWFSVQVPLFSDNDISSDEKLLAAAAKDIHTALRIRTEVSTTTQRRGEGGVPTPTDVEKERLRQIIATHKESKTRRGHLDIISGEVDKSLRVVEQSNGFKSKCMNTSEELPSSIHPSHRKLCGQLGGWRVVERPYTNNPLIAIFDENFFLNIATKGSTQPSASQELVKSASRTINQLRPSDTHRLADLEEEEEEADFSGEVGGSGTSVNPPLVAVGGVILTHENGVHQYDKRTLNPGKPINEEQPSIKTKGYESQSGSPPQEVPTHRYYMPPIASKAFRNDAPQKSRHSPLFNPYSALR